MAVAQFVPRQLQPLCGSPSQLTQFGEHELMWHVPFWHDELAK